MRIPMRRAFYALAFTTLSLGVLVVFKLPEPSSRRPPPGDGQAPDSVLPVLEDMPGDAGRVEHVRGEGGEDEREDEREEEQPNWVLGRHRQRPAEVLTEEEDDDPKKEERRYIRNLSEISVKPIPPRTKSVPVPVANFSEFWTGTRVATVRGDPAVDDPADEERPPVKAKKVAWRKMPTRKPVRVMKALWEAIRNGDNSEYERYVRDGWRAHAAFPPSPPSFADLDASTWRSTKVHLAGGQSLLAVAAPEHALHAAKSNASTTVLALETPLDNALDILPTAWMRDEAGLDNTIVCTPRSLPSALSALYDDPRAFFGGVVLGNLSALVEDLLPHEFEKALGHAVSLGATIVIRSMPSRGPTNTPDFFKYWDSTSTLISRALEIAGVVADVQVISDFYVLTVNQTVREVPEEACAAVVSHVPGIEREEGRGCYVVHDMVAGEAPLVPEDAEDDDESMRTKKDSKKLKDKDSKKTKKKKKKKKKDADGAEDNYKVKSSNDYYNSYSYGSSSSGSSNDYSRGGGNDDESDNKDDEEEEDEEDEEEEEEEVPFIPDVPVYYLQYGSRELPYDGVLSSIALPTILAAEPIGTDRRVLFQRMLAMDRLTWMEVSAGSGDGGVPADNVRLSGAMLQPVDLLDLNMTAEVLREEEYQLEEERKAEAERNATLEKLRAERDSEYDDGDADYNYDDDDDNGYDRRGATRPTPWDDDGDDGAGNEEEAWRGGGERDARGRGASGDPGEVGRDSGRGQKKLGEKSKYAIGDERRGAEDDDHRSGHKSRRGGDDGYKNKRNDDSYDNRGSGGYTGRGGGSNDDDDDDDDNVYQRRDDRNGYKKRGGYDDDNNGSGYKNGGDDNDYDGGNGDAKDDDGGGYRNRKDSDDDDGGGYRNRKDGDDDDGGSYRNRKDGDDDDGGSYRNRKDSDDDDGGSYRNRKGGDDNNGGGYRNRKDGDDDGGGGYRNRKDSDDDGGATSSGYDDDDDESGYKNRDDDDNDNNSRYKNRDNDDNGSGSGYKNRDDDDNDNNSRYKNRNNDSGHKDRDDDDDDDDNSAFPNRDDDTGARKRGRDSDDGTGPASGEREHDNANANAGEGGARGKRGSPTSADDDADDDGTAARGTGHATSGERPGEDGEQGDDAAERRDGTSRAQVGEDRDDMLGGKGEDALDAALAASRRLTELRLPDRAASMYGDAWDVLYRAIHEDTANDAYTSSPHDDQWTQPTQVPFTVLSFGRSTSLLAAKVARNFPRAQVLTVIPANEKAAIREHKRLISTMSLHNNIVYANNLSPSTVLRVHQYPEVLRFQILGTTLFDSYLSMSPSKFVSHFGRLLALAQVSFIEAVSPDQMALAVAIFGGESTEMQGGIVVAALEAAGLEDYDVEVLGAADQKARGRMLLRVTLRSFTRPVHGSCSSSARPALLTVSEGSAALDDVRLPRAFQAVSLQFLLALGLSRHQKRDFFSQYLSLPLLRDMCPFNIVVRGGNLTLEALGDRGERMEAEQRRLEESSAMVQTLIRALDYTVPFSFLEHGSRSGDISIPLARKYPDSSFFSLEADYDLSEEHYEKVLEKNITNNVLLERAPSPGLMHSLFESPEFLKYQYLPLHTFMGFVGRGGLDDRSKLDTFLGEMLASGLSNFLQVPGAKAISLAFTTLFPLPDPVRPYANQYLRVKDDYRTEDHPLPAFEAADQRMLGEAARANVYNSTVEPSILHPSPYSDGSLPPWAIVRVDIRNVTYMVHHHFDYQLDGHERKYVLHATANSTSDYKVYLTRSKEAKMAANNVIPYEHIESITLIALLRLNLKQEQRERFYNGFLRLPMFEDMTTWNIVFRRSEMQYIDYDTRDTTLDNLVPGAFQVMAMLLNYERTIKDFNMCGQKGKNPYGFGFVSSCVGNRWNGECRNTSLPVPCGDGRCHHTYIDCLQSLAQMEQKRTALSQKEYSNLLSRVIDARVPTDEQAIPGRDTWTFDNSGYKAPKKFGHEIEKYKSSSYY